MATKTTKLTDEQIIEKLKGLREGDVLIGVSGKFKRNVEYRVKVDAVGDKYVINALGNERYINIDEAYDYSAFRAIRDGELRFKESARTPEFFHIKSSCVDFRESEAEITIHTDIIGYSRIIAIDNEVNAEHKLARLHAQKAEINARLAKLNREVMLNGETL